MKQQLGFWGDTVGFGGWFSHFSNNTGKRTMFEVGRGRILKWYGVTQSVQDHFNTSSSSKTLSTSQSLLHQTGWNNVLTDLGCEDILDVLVEICWNIPSCGWTSMSHWALFNSDFHLRVSWPEVGMLGTELLRPAQQRLEWAIDTDNQINDLVSEVDDFYLSSYLPSS